MPPRRSHKKSRAGCRRCKSRKIKCDEVHPRCGNCVKHGVACDFEHPELAESLLVPETPGPSSASFCASPATEGRTPSVSGASSKPVTIYRNPDPPMPLSSTSTSHRLMELRLLHHFTTVTCKTLVPSDPNNEYIWRDTVPNIAFNGSNFLVDAMLATSALHLRSLTPNDQEVVRASHAYMASTLSEYADSLRKGINEHNAEPLFLTATLIALQSTASRIFSRDDGGDVRDRNDTYTPPIGWFHSFQGVKTIVATSWQYLRNSGIVIPLIESQPALNLNLGSGQSTFFGHLLDNVEAELANEDPSTQMLSRQAYQHAVAVLNWAHKIPHSGAPMVFLATVSRRYLDLLQMRRPRALAILASEFALLKQMDSVWWARGIARREVMGIVSLFDPDDEEWWPKLQWPVRIALYDGEIIPPEIWGADWAMEGTLLNQARLNGGGFVTHIELLTQMFDAMQNMPPEPMNGLADELYGSAESIIQTRQLIADLGLSTTPAN